MPNVFTSPSNETPAIGRTALSVKGRKTDEGTEIPMGLSRQEIAEMIGTTVETTIRVMSRWGRNGVIVTGHGRFVVPSCDALRAIAEGRAEG